MSALDVIVLAIAGLNLWAYVELTGHLEARHRPLWDQLGQPKIYNDYRNLFQPSARFWGFVYSGVFWRNDDRRVRLLGGTFLGSNLLLLAFMIIYFLR